LRESGVLIVGSGNVVHNLRRIQWEQPDAGFDWARSFDEAAVQLMMSAPGDIASLQQHDAFELAVPTPDHFIPLLYLAGLAAAADRPAEVLVDGYAMGSLSMTSYTLDASCGVDSTNAEGAPPLPEVPADETNM
jgi:4,5-DOPA dioxygenase extradiol